VQLSLFSLGAANNAVFICMAAEPTSFLAAADGFFLELSFRAASSKLEGTSPKVACLPESFSLQLKADS